MKKNGFIFVETIVVIVVVATSLILIYSSFNNILVNEKKRSAYDDTTYLYRTYFLENFIVSLNFDKYLKTYGVNSRGEEMKAISFSCNLNTSNALFNLTDEYGNNNYNELKKEKFCEKLFSSSEGFGNVARVYITKYYVGSLIDCIDNYTCNTETYTLSAGAKSFIRTLPRYPDATVSEEDKNAYRLIVEYVENYGNNSFKNFYSSVKLVNRL